MVLVYSDTERFDPDFDQYYCMIRLAPELLEFLDDYSHGYQYWRFDYYIDR